VQAPCGLGRAEHQVWRPDSRCAGAARRRRGTGGVEPGGGLGLRSDGGGARANLVARRRDGSFGGGVARPSTGLTGQIYHSGAGSPGFGRALFLLNRRNSRAPRKTVAPLYIGGNCKSSPFKKFRTRKPVWISPSTVNSVFWKSFGGLSVFPLYIRGARRRPIVVPNVLDRS
jgi:hypothetical protein